MNQLNVFAAALTLALIIGNVAVYYAGKRAGRQDAARDMREQSLDIDGRANMAAPGAAGLGAGGTSLFDGAGRSATFDAPAGDVPSNINFMPIRVCGIEYRYIPVSINGVDVLARIGRIADSEVGMPTPAGRLCTTLRARYSAGSQIPTSMRQTDGPEIGAGVHIVESFDTFVIDPISGAIHFLDPATNIIGQRIGSLY